MKYCDACHTTYPNEFQVCPKDQGALRTVSELTPGMVIRDKYQIMDKIGAGGMAVVYKAKHLAFNELRAIKVVNSRLLDDETFLKRFKGEAIITRKLQHPNAVRVDDLDSTEDGRPFMVMEYVHGRDLRHVISQSGPLPVRRALTIARQVAAALSAAHAIGITHRDIKPDNILITDPGDGSDLVKVLDFGIAKVREAGLEASHGSTKTGMVVGTPQYISPEQAMGKRGDQIDGRADLYSLGVVLYEMVTGRLPFESDTPMGMLLQHIQATPTPAHEISPELRIPESVSLLLVRALEKDRELRFQDAEEMIEELDAVEHGLRQRTAELAPTRQVAARAATAPARSRTPTPRPAPHPPARHAPAPPARSSSWVIYLVAVVLIVGVAGGAYYYLVQPADAAGTQDGGPQLSPDERMVADVKSALAGSGEIKSPITVNALDGVVTLSGKVSGLFESQMAEYYARGVSGVKEVKNELEYEKKPAVVTSTEPSPTPTPTASAPPREERRKPPEPRGPSAADKARARDLIAQGNQQVESGQYDAAIGSFNQALALDPDNSAARQGLSRALKAKQTEEDILRRR